MNLLLFTVVALICGLATAAEPVEVANNGEVRVTIELDEIVQAGEEGDGRHAKVAFHYKLPVKTDSGVTYDRLETLYSIYCDERIFVKYKLAAYDASKGETAVRVWTGASRADYTVPDPLSLDGAVVRVACAVRRPR